MEKEEGRAEMIHSGVDYYVRRITSVSLVLLVMFTKYPKKINLPSIPLLPLHSHTGDGRTTGEERMKARELWRRKRIRRSRGMLYAAPGTACNKYLFDTQLVYKDNRIRRTVESDRRGRCLSKGKDKGREGTAGKGGKDM